ncbi:TIGR02611 family protein [Iamia sp. SCSIO 61187]|uniref:PGPGW domain-containing protein n=1 Tax=Iamia sp. SCSIO 61187 TaxID=2722752 RepID=UPI001C631441|nr:PGPGW domain-containing protein [Iamia sp. SCSIO 61187]QYG92660.1 TIGR02611 family protein [Iamia sp. SCSIO 61187]
MADDQLTAEERLRLREERRERYRAAAVDAERDTGRRERTVEEAKRNIIVRMAIIAFGTLVTLAGLGMLVLPGPGIVVVIAGLGILATEVSWAERLLAYAKRKANVDSITDQHPWVKPVSIVLMVLGVAVSVLYAVVWR